MLGLIQCKIQKGTGTGAILIDKVDVSKSIILTSVSTTAVFTDSTHITLGASTSWTVIEFGGAV
jgi:hypothetical protein